MQSNKKVILTESVILALAFFILYIFTLSENLSAAHDSISYINAIDLGVNLFHQHHLLYNWFAAHWIKFLNFFGLKIDSMVLVEALNAIFGSLTLGLFYLFLRARVFLTRTVSIIGTTLPAFSYGFWAYSCNVEVYIIPLFFLMLSFYLLSSEQISSKTFIFVGITHGIAILFHQMNILFFFVVMYAIFSYYKKSNSACLKEFAYYFLSIIPVVSIPYIWVISRLPMLHSPAKVVYWLTEYAHKQSYWSKFGLFSFVKASIGFIHSLIGGHFIFCILNTRDFIGGILKDKLLIDELFLVRNLGEIRAYGLTALFAIFVFILIVGVINLLCRFRPLSYFQDTLLRISAIWLIVYTIFFFFWEPTNCEFWIPQSLCFWLIFIMLWNKHNSKLKSFGKISLLYISIISVLLFVINFFGSIQWMTHKENDYYYVKIQTLTKNAKQGDLAIIGRSWILKSYVSRYAKAEILSLSDVLSRLHNEKEAFGYVEQSIKGTLDKGKKVLISNEAVDLEPQTIQDFGGGMLVFNKIWDIYKKNWVKLGSGIDVVYIIERKK